MSRRHRRRSRRSFLAFSLSPVSLLCPPFSSIAATRLVDQHRRNPRTRVGSSTFLTRHPYRPFIWSPRRGVPSFSTSLSRITRSNPSEHPQHSQLDSSGCPVDDQGKRLFEVNRGRPNWSAPTNQISRFTSRSVALPQINLPSNPGPIRTKVEIDSSDNDKDSVEKLVSPTSSPSSESSIALSTPQPTPSNPSLANSPIPPSTPTPSPTLTPPLPSSFSMTSRHLPFRNENSAPRWNGKPENLDRFFSDVKHVCDICIQSATDKNFVEQFFNYLDNDQFLTLEHLRPSSGTTVTWAQFKSNIWSLYPEFRQDRRYTTAMVEELVTNFSRIENPTLENWGEFNRQFGKMTGKLIATRHLSDSDKPRYLQRALHQTLWAAVLSRLQSVHPNHDPWLPFTYDEICAEILWVARWNSGAASNGYLTLPVPQPILPPPPNTTINRLPPAPTHSAILPPPNATHPTISDPSIQFLPYRPPPLLTAPPISPTTQSAIKTEPTDQAFTTDEVSRIRQLLNTRQEPRTDQQFRGCLFCGDLGHFIRECPLSIEYINTGKCRRGQWGQLTFADGSPIPNGTGTLQEKVDRQIGSVITGFCGLAEGPGFESFHTPVIAYDDTPTEDWDPEVFTSWVQNKVEKEGISEVLATLRSGKVTDKPKGKEREKLVRFDTSTSGPSSRSPRPSPTTSIAPTSQTDYPPSNEPAYRYQSSIGSRFDPSKMADQLLNAPVTVTIGEMLAASPDLQRSISDQLRRKRVPLDGSRTSSTFAALETSDAASFQGTGHVLGHDGFPISREALALRVVRPNWENSRCVFDCILDSGSQINVIRKDVCDALGLAVLPGERVTMESADGRKSETLGQVHNAVMCFNGIRLPVKAQVMKNAPYQILLGQPFFALTSLRAQHYLNGDVEVRITDPTSDKELIIPTFSRGNSHPPIQGF